MNAVSAIADIATATPAQIDAALGEVESQTDLVVAGIQDAQAKIVLAEAYARTPTASGNRARVQEAAARAQARLPELEEERSTLRARADWLNAEFVRRGGWTRYYLVDSHDGHIHRDRAPWRCSRQVTTRYWWLTEESGRRAEDVVAEAKAQACTICFPWAPVVKEDGRWIPPVVQAAREAAAARRAQADAKKAAELRIPEGEPLVVTDGLGMKDTLRTDRAAWNWLMREAESLAWYGEDEDTATVRKSAELVLAVLSTVRGTSVEDLRAELNAKTARKLAKQDAVVKATV